MADTFCLAEFDLYRMQIHPARKTDHIEIRTALSMVQCNANGVFKMLKIKILTCKTRR